MRWAAPGAAKAGFSHERGAGMGGGAGRRGESGIDHRVSNEPIAARRPNYRLLVVGAVLAILAAGVTWNAVDYRLSSTVVTGTVVRLPAGGHHPEVGFDAPDGTHYTRPLGSWRAVEPGHHVPVRLRATAKTAARAACAQALHAGCLCISAVVLPVSHIGRPLRQAARAARPFGCK